MPSTSNPMINNGCHTSFRWETKFGCTCRKNSLQGLTRSFVHSVMYPTPSPSLWVTMLLISTFPVPWLALNIQCGPPSALFSTIIGHLRDNITIETNRSQPWMHGKDIHWSYCGHTGQGHSPAEDPTLSSYQSRVVPAPGQVAHPGTNSAEISSSDGGTQCNGYHCFLREEDWSRRILVATHLVQLAQNNFLATYYF
jgi:hypothetical protein